MPDRHWWAALWPDPEAVLQAVHIKPGSLALDLCCGDGYFTAPLAKLLDGQVFALDLDHEMIDRARAEVRRLHTSVRRWLVADARNVGDLLAEKVDYVLIANTFHGVPDQPGLCASVSRALNDQGRFAVINWHALAREETIIAGEPRGPKNGNAPVA